MSCSIIKTNRGEYELVISESGLEKGEIKFSLSLKSENLIYSSDKLPLIEIAVSEALEEIETKTYHYQTEAGVKEVVTHQQFLFYPPVKQIVKSSEISIVLDEVEECLRIQPRPASIDWITIGYSLPRGLCVGNQDEIIEANMDWIKHTLRVHGYQLIME